MKNKLSLLGLVLIFAFGLGRSANAQWVQAKGLYGGVSVTSFAVIGSDVFAGTNGGVYHSADSKTEWSLTPLTYPITALAVIGTNVFAVSSDSGIFLSTDNGTTWNPVNNGLKSTVVTAIAANGIELFAGITSGYGGGGFGIYRSTDTGKSWAKDSSFTSACTVTAITANGPNIVVATPCGIVESTNDGKTWIESNNSPNNVWFNAFTSIGTNIFAGTDSGVYLSTNNGANWTSANSNLPHNPDPVGYNVLSIAADSNIIFAGMGCYTLDGAFGNYPGLEWYGTPEPAIDSIYSTTNNGVSWAASSSGMTSIQVNAFAVLGADIYAGTPTGIYLSTDNGKTWAEANYGLTSVPVRSFAALGKNLFAGTTDGVYISTDSGAEWSSTHSNLSRLVAFDYIFAPPLLSAGTDNVYAWYLDTLDFSTDNGKDWISTTVPSGDLGSYTPFVVSGPNLYAAGYPGVTPGVYVSSNNGKTWTMKSGGIPKVENVISNMTTSGDTIFAITYDSIYASVDDCTTWRSESIGCPLSPRSGPSINAFIANGNDLYAVIYGSIMDSLFHSTDNGASWTSVGFPTSSDYTLAIPLAVSGTNIIAGVGDSVYISSDNGASWEIANDGLLEPCGFNTFTIIGNYVIAGTSTQGIWRRPLSELFPTSGVAEQQAPSFDIQSYPNPFSQSTTISFSSPESGVAEITIVNLLGSEVARIFSGELAAGRHEFTWDASGMPPGMYEGIVRVNGRVQFIPIIHS